MCTLLIFGAIIIIVIIIAATKGSSNIKSLANLPLEERLGTELDEIKPITEKLEHALPETYVKHIKQRVLKEYPKWADHEFEWAFYELKRYFLINSLFKSVPMFSDKADTVWHEMLMFTKEYEQFAKNFYDDYLHHSPNMEEQPLPNERAFFDWVFISLFKPSENTIKIWGPFLQSPLSDEVLADFENLSDEKLLSKYFRNNSQWTDVQIMLINKLKYEIKSAHQFKKQNQLPAINSNKEWLSQTVIGAAIFFSIYGSEDYLGHMSSYLPQEWTKQTYASTTSCSGFACSSNHNHHDSTDGGGSGSSSDSGSSCGSGCGSS